MIIGGSFGRRFFDSFVPRVDATFYLPKDTRAMGKQPGEPILRPGWYLPFAVTRVVQPFEINYLEPTPEEPYERMTGISDGIYDMSGSAALQSFEVNYKLKKAVSPLYTAEDGEEKCVPIVFATHSLSRLFVSGVLNQQNEAYYGTLNAPDMDDRLVGVAAETSFSNLNELLRLFEDRTIRYVQEHLPRQQRRASGMSATALHFRVITRGERVQYKREDLQTIAQIKRKMHVVRGFERTYTSDRYIHMKGKKQFIKPHIRGSLGTAVQIPDYRVES